MRLLMITRKVDKDDALAGFAYDWLEKIGPRLEKLYVICWQTSTNDNLPDNIKIINLSQRSKLIKIFDFQVKVWQVIRRIDGVFFHMNPEYTI